MERESVGPPTATIDSAVVEPQRHEIFAVWPSYSDLFRPPVCPRELITPGFYATSPNAYSAIR